MKTDDIKYKRCKRKNDANNYFCYLCNVDTPVMNAEELTNHYSTCHPGARTFYRKIEDFTKLSHACDICGSTFETIMEAEEHINQHEDQYTCTYCGMKFKKTLEYAMHVYEHTKIAKCELCNGAFKDKRKLHNHYAVHLNSMKPFICDVENCNRRFQVLVLLRDHHKRHIRVRNYQCDICPSNFITENDLKSHAHAVHPERITGIAENYECKECDVRFKHVVTFKRHMAKSHSNKKHICDKCGKSFYNSYNLRQHSKYHEERTLQCKYCDRKFHLRKGLKSHELTHTGEKRYPCRYCDKRFGQSSVRRTHERLHTNERPYCCDLCGKGYTSRAARNAHKNKCTG